MKPSTFAYFICILSLIVYVFRRTYTLSSISITSIDFNVDDSGDVITGNGFRKLASSVCEHICPVPAHSNSVNVFFVKPDLLDTLASESNFRFGTPTVIVSHNGDIALSEYAIKRFEKNRNVRAIYVQNIARGLETYPRNLYSIPIGLENKRFSFGRFAERLYPFLFWRTQFELNIRAYETIREEEDVPVSMLLAFNVSTNRNERCIAWKTLKEKVDVPVVDLIDEQEALRLCEGVEMSPQMSPQLQLVQRTKQDSKNTRLTVNVYQQGQVVERNEDEVRKFSNFLDEIQLDSQLSPRLKEYVRNLVSTVFVVSPPGNGFQCHRTFEALYSGNIPIVLHTGSPMDDVLLGLPAVSVHSWAQVSLHSLRLALLRIRHAYSNTVAKKQSTENVLWDPILAMKPLERMSQSEISYVERSRFDFDRLNMSTWRTMIMNSE